MTKDQADELKRLIRAVRDAEHRGTLANETFYATQAEKAAAAYIDSLTQQPAELEEARKDAERLREAGARLYAAIGDHLPAGPLPVELKDTAQAWIDAAKEQGK